MGLLSCTTTKATDPTGPNYSAIVQGVYKMTYIAYNGGTGTAVSNPSDNVLVNYYSNAEVSIKEVIGNNAINFPQVMLVDAGSNKLTFSQNNGSQSISGYFLNRSIEYTLIDGSTSKSVKAHL